MSEPIKKFGINAILMMIIGGFVLPVVIYIANQAVSVPELKVEIRHLSTSIDRLVVGIERFERTNNDTHQVLAEGLYEMRDNCDDNAKAIQELRNGH